jgi:hypothetical protein
VIRVESYKYEQALPLSRTGIDIDRSEPGVGGRRARGEHESSPAPKLGAELDALLEEGTAIVVDLNETTFVASAVVSVLLRGRTEAHERGARSRS